MGTDRSALTLSPALGPIVWDGSPASNHAQVLVDGEAIGILLRLDLSEQREDGLVIPASRPYVFEPMESSGLVAMASLHRDLLLKEIAAAIP